MRFAGPWRVTLGDHLGSFPRSPSALVAVCAVLAAAVVLGGPFTAGTPSAEPAFGKDIGAVGESLPDLGLLASVIVTSAAAIWGAVALGGGRTVLVVVGLAATLGSLTLGVVWPGLFAHTRTTAAMSWNGLLAVAGGVVLWCAAVAVRRGDRASWSPLGKATAAWLLGLAFLGRWRFLSDTFHLPLAPDVKIVAMLARRMDYLYDTDFREPLWVWLAKLFQLAFGSDAVSARYFSLALSLVLLYLAYRFVRDYTGSTGLALLTLLFLARHGYLVESSSLGLRTEQYIVTILLLTYFVFVPGLRGPTRSVGLTVTTALMALTQLSGLAVAVLLTIWAAWRHRLGWTTPALAVVVACLVIAPHLLNNAREHDDPFWSQTVHAVWYRNQEYVGVRQIGCEGCPSPEQYQRDSYSGSRVSMAGYVFGMHPVSEVVTRVARGYVDLYLNPGLFLGTLLGTATVVGYALYFAGVVIFLVTPLRELLLVPLLAINLLAFVIPVGVDVRLVVHPAPFAAFAMALPIWCIGRLLLVGRTGLVRELALLPGRHPRLQLLDPVDDDVDLVA